MCRSAGNQLLAAIGGTQAGWNEASSQRPRHTQRPDGGNQGTQGLPRLVVFQHTHYFKYKNLIDMTAGRAYNDCE